MNIQYLYSFIQVVRCRSYSKASFELYISQPALSQQIKKLESDIGFELFDHKNKNAVSLTKAGELFYDYAVSAVREYENIIKTCLTSAGKMVGIVFGADYRDFQLLKPNFFKQFRNKFPQYDLKVKLGNWENMMEQLESGKLDIVYSSEPLNMPKGYCFEELNKLGFAITGLKENPVFGKPISLEALRGHKLSLPTDQIGIAVKEANADIRKKYPEIILTEPYSDVNIHNMNDPDELYLTINTSEDIFPDLLTQPLLSDYYCPMGLIFRKEQNDIVSRMIQTYHDLPV